MKARARAIMTPVAAISSRSGMRQSVPTQHGTPRAEGSMGTPQRRGGSMAAAKKNTTTMTMAIRKSHQRT